MARRIARAYNLTEVEVQRAYLAARLHDVAAAILPDDVVLDGDVLDESQRAYARSHAEAGAAYVSEGLKLPGVAEAIRYHHERFDGRGYPRGIAGEDIPHEARIVAIADAWVTLTSPSAYRPALRESQALLVLRAGAGTKWDPVIVGVVTGLIEGDARPAAEGILAFPPAPVLVRAVA